MNATELKSCCDPPVVFEEEFNTCSQKNFLKTDFKRGSEVKLSALRKPKLMLIKIFSAYSSVCLTLLKWPQTKLIASKTQ